MSADGEQGAQLGLTAHFVLSPVGLDAETTCAALRAHVSRLRQTDIYLPLPIGPEAEAEAPLVAGCVPELDPTVQGPERLLTLALGALRGLIERASMARAELSRTGILIALPSEDEVTTAWKLRDSFMAALLARAGLREVAQERRAVSLGGNAGLPSLLRTAVTWMDARSVEQCIVLGVDSHIDFGRLRALDLAYRLKSERGVDGFVPGEAAVALLVERIGPRIATRRPCLSRLTLPQMADEPRPMSGDKPSTGTALSTVLRGAIASLPKGRLPGWILCDMNGESYRGFEWGLARVRLGDHLAGRLTIQHPADCIGDTGAACAGLLVSCATQAYLRGYAPEDAALVWTASTDGARAAMLVLPPMLMREGRMNGFSSPVEPP